jgi:2-amino-4-hydroxy-6-hydroxymethyldihydropteridine diphosphokinase
LIKTGITAYLGLGSNLGEKKDNLKTALEKLSDEPEIIIEKYSSIYLTEPVGASEQSDFYNCTAKIMTTLSPDELLAVLKKIEKEMGRHPESHLQPRKGDGASPGKPSSATAYRYRYFALRRLFNRYIGVDDSSFAVDQTAVRAGAAIGTRTGAGSAAIAQAVA